MIGIIFLALIGFWIWCSAQITKWLFRRVSSLTLRRLLSLIIFVALLVLPVADELIAGFQFRSLCAKNAGLKVDANKIKGKSVRVITDPVNKEVDGTLVRILYSHASYRDVNTNEELASYGQYVANGGWLIRKLSTDEYITPLTFSSSCSGELKLANYEFTLIK